MLLPIRAEIRTRRPAIANYSLIAVNILIFIAILILSNVSVKSISYGLPEASLGEWIRNTFMLHASSPAWYEYITYQFLHGDWMHLLGNMLFLYIFGNAVCDRMGGLAYLLFYLAGGVCAGIVFTMGAANPMLGASGAIAAVTTAFLVLFPRVPITMLLFYFLITTFQLPSMILIIFKIILWDNLIAPSFQNQWVSSVAYSAHLGGYAFGFVIGIVMLLWGILPRNQFDMLSLIGRWRRRKGLSAASTPRYHRQYAGRQIHAVEMASEPIRRVEATPIEKKRQDIATALERGDLEKATLAYRELLRLDPEQVLPHRQQLEIANRLQQVGAYPEGVAAYEGLLGAYPGAADASQVRLLVGLICNRYLHDYEKAVHYLGQAVNTLKDETQRSLAVQELGNAEANLFGPKPPENPPE